MIEPGPLITTHHVDYDTALLATITCTFDDHYNWRVPTEDEWVSYNWIPSWSWNAPRMYRYSRTPHSFEFRSYELCIVRTIDDRTSSPIP